MEIDTLNTKTSYTRKNRSPNSSLFTYDLPSLIKKMKHTPKWENGELNAMILLRSPGKQIVLTAMHEKTEVTSFQSGDSITFQIIEGKMMFQTRKESTILYKGQLLTLHDNIKFSLTTLEESVFLLTIFTGSLKSVKN